jgi:DsbC/DsbD-like thiol-disulfide interchange protein
MLQHPTILKFLRHLCLFAAILTSAQADATRHERATFEFISEQTALVPGQTTTIGLRIIHDKDWHTYWKFPGVAGVPTQIKWSLPKGLTASPIIWQHPQRTKMSVYDVYGYEGEAILLTEITAVPDFKSDKPVQLKTEITGMMCAQVCIPFYINLDFQIPVASESKPIEKNKAVIDKIRAEFPKPTNTWKTSSTWSADKTHITLTLLPPESLIDPFFFNDNGLIESDVPQKAKIKEEGKIEITFKVTEFAPENPTHVTGILETKQGNFAINAPLK